MTTADQTAAADQTATLQVAPAQTPGGRWSAVRARAPYLIQETVGLVPPLSAIGVAAVFQTQTINAVFGWWWCFAWLPAACIEGGAMYFGFLYERHLVAGDSTLAPRVWMLICAGISCATIYWHVTVQLQKPWQMAAVVGGMAALSLALWMRRSKWKRRELLRDRGLLDAQAPRFSLARWIFCPIETPRAFRHAIKYGISDPTVAVDRYRAKVDADKAAKAADQTATPEPEVAKAPVRRQQTPKPRAPKQTEVSAAPDETELDRTDLPPVVPIVSASDADMLQTIRESHHGRDLPTLGAIRKAIVATGQTCGQTKAIRLRGLLEAEGAREQTADPEPAAAAAN